MNFEINGQWMNEDDIGPAWKTGNDNGDGYAVGNEDDSPLAAVDRDGLLNYVATLDDGIVVATDDRGQVIAVADCNGPWAVEIGEPLNP